MVYSRNFSQVMIKLQITFHDKLDANGVAIWKNICPEAL